MLHKLDILEHASYYDTILVRFEIFLKSMLPKRNLKASFQEYLFLEWILL